MQTQVVTLRWYNCIHYNIDNQKQKQTIAFKLYYLDIKVNLKLRSYSVYLSIQITTMQRTFSQQNVLEKKLFIYYYFRPLFCSEKLPFTDIVP